VLFCDEPGGVGGEGLGRDVSEASDPDGVNLAIFEERVDGGAADGKPSGRLFDGEQGELNIGRLPVEGVGGAIRWSPVPSSKPGSVDERCSLSGV
jgi:hypothetical protein